MPSCSRPPRPISRSRASRSCGSRTISHRPSASPTAPSNSREVTSLLEVLATSETDIGWIGLAASLVLIAIVVVLSLVQHLDLERSIIWAAVRAMIQLLLVGYALTFIIDPKQPVLFAWLWVLLMVAVA